ncbi:helix-turn-helix domain-containing protein [Mycobacterium sp. Z3061]|uniref:helix-turn-helix domain-containing protein n=1 Tax=Mycobacterium sp. Z3061 TaxID=3073562 RepID=UPI003D819BDE
MGISGLFCVFYMKGREFMKLNEVYPLDNIERLILLRRQLNMTQFQFAKEIGISPSTLSQIERGYLY